MLSFASATGNLFNVLGKLGALIENLAAYQSTQQTAMIDTVSGVVAQLDDESDIQALMGSAYIGILNSFGSVGSTSQQIAEAVVNRKVFRDFPQFNQNLTQYNTLTSLQEVIRQMYMMGATILAMTITATPEQFYNFQNNILNPDKGIVVASTVRPLDGLTLENTFAETLIFRVTADSYNNGAIEGNEPLQLTGEGSEPDYFAFDWPLGSNCFTQLSAINSTVNNQQGNLLTNSSFETFTVANTPDNWEIVIGTPGTDIFEETSIVYDGPPNKAIRILGDGATLIQFRQEFNDSTNGTGGQLTNVTQYAINLFLCRDGVAAATGELTVDLVDENFNVTQDEAGVNNSFVIDLTALTVNYESYTGVFRTPSILPTTFYLRIRETVAYESGRSFYLDFIGMGQMTQCYTSGPFVAVFSGKTPFEAGDYSFCTITNSRGAAGTLNTWQTLLARLFPDLVYGNELIFPSSATPSISDSLIG